MSRVLFATSFETLDQVSWRPEIEGTGGVHRRVDQGKVALRPTLQEEGKQLAFQNYLDRETDRSDQQSWPQACWTEVTVPSFHIPASGGTQNPGEFSRLQEHTVKVSFVCQISIRGLPWWRSG